MVFSNSMNEETVTPNSLAANKATSVESENSVMTALSQAEHDILRIWQELFKIEDIDIQSDFFDLGGHSFLLAKLQIAMKREFNVQLTAAEVFRHPTIAGLAAWLERTQSAPKLAAVPRADTPTQNPRIIPIQPLGASRPVFAISQSMIFRHLAMELGPDQPVYAVQMLEEDIAAMGSASFEELTDFYVRLIREMQPEGPYRLAGWCVSGWIAYGVARQLETQGAEIEMLIVIDSWAPAYWSSQPRIHRALLRTVYGIQHSLWVGRRLRQTNATQSGTYIQRSLPGIAAAVQKVTARFGNRGLLAEMHEIEELGRNNQLERTASRAALAGPLQGKVLLFRSEEEQTGPFLSPDMGWSQMLDRSVQVEALPGDHHEIFDLPGARVMAARVNEMLCTLIPPVLSLDTLPSSERKNTEVQSSAGIPLVRA